MATYLILNLIVLAGVAVIAIAKRFRFSTRWGMTLLALLVLTLVFDNLIVGFGIVTYNPAQFLGIRLGTAPLEDFAYSIAVSILVPLLWRMGSRS